MTTNELAVRIYDHITSLNRHGEHWDNWDDLREVKFIESLIDNQHKPKSSPTWDDVRKAIEMAREVIQTRHETDDEIIDNYTYYSKEEIIEQLKKSK